VAVTLLAADPEFTAAAGQAGGSFLMTAAEYNLEEMKTHRVLHVVSAVHAPQAQPPPGAPGAASGQLPSQPASPTRLPHHHAGGGGGGEGGGSGAVAARGSGAFSEGSRSGRFAASAAHAQSAGGTGERSAVTSVGGGGGEGGEDPAAGGFSAAALASSAANALAELGNRGAEALAALAQPLGGTFAARSSGISAAAAAAAAAAAEGGVPGDAEGGATGPPLQLRHGGGPSGAGAGSGGQPAPRRPPAPGGPGAGPSGAQAVAPAPAPAPAAALLSNFARKVFVTVYADGPTRVLCFSDEPFAGATGEEGGLQATGYRLQQASGQCGARGGSEPGREQAGCEPCLPWRHPCFPLPGAANLGLRPCRPHPFA
jgi:hypothetical protein